jgi:hypothetical protein
MNYGRWLPLFGMAFGYGKRVWVLGELEGASGFCGWPVSEVK